jgi:mannosyltransferase
MINKNLIIVLFLVILNIVLKSLFLGSQEIDIDEPFSIYNAQGSIKDILLLMPGENNPPLFFIVLHYWIKLFGINPVSVRFLPMIFSSLTVIFIYLTGSRFFNIVVAITASILFSFSNLNMFHAHDTRVYSLFVLLATASMYQFLVFIETKKSRPLVVFTILNILLGYAHFFGFFIFALQFVVVFTIKTLREWQYLKKYLLFVFIHFLFYLPYLQVFTKRFFSSSTQGTWVAKPIISDLWQRLWMFSNGPENMYLFLLLIFLAIMFIILSSFKTTPYAKIIFAWFVIPYCFMFIVSFKIPMFIDKYLIYITPGYYLSVAIATGFIYNVKSTDINYQRKNPVLSNFLKFIVKRSVVISIVAAFIVCFAMIRKANLNYNHNRYPSQVVDLISKNQNDSTIVVLCPAWIELNIAYYYSPEAFKSFGKVSEKLKKLNVFPAYNVKSIDETVFLKYTNALYIDGWSSLTDSDSTIYKKLEVEYGSRKLIGDFNGYMVFLFNKHQ